MRLNDISADMHDYLENRCYCPGEIYDRTGFFFNVYKETDECEMLCDGEKGYIHGTFVIVGNQIIYFESTDGKINDALRLDATDNNKKQIVDFMSGKIDKMSIDEFDETNTEENLDEVLQLVDAVMN